MMKMNAKLAIQKLILQNSNYRNRLLVPRPSRFFLTIQSATMVNKIKSRLAYRPASLLTVAIAMAVALIFYFGTVQAIDNAARQRFDTYSNTARAAVEARIKSYIDLGRSTAALIRTRHPLLPRELADFVEGIDVPANYPAVLGINFAEYVLDKDRARFEQRMRNVEQADGTLMRDFEIYPPGRRPTYHVATLVALTGSTERVLIGGDIGPVRPVKHDQMRDDGKLTSSGIPIPKLSRPNKAVLAVRVPTYHPRLPVTTIAERRAAYLGSAGVMFSVPELVAGVLGQMPVKNVRMILVDRALRPEQSASQVLFDSHYGIPQPSGMFNRPVERFSTAMPVGFVDRSWEATFSVEKNAMLNVMETLIPWLSMLTGFVGTMLVHALFTELKRKEQQSRHKALHDTLTGLPNRALLLSRLDHAIDMGRRNKQRLMLFFIDIDRFKWVNDNLGHDVGDALLIDLARRMSACLRPSDILARIGGDEFVLLGPRTGSRRSGTPPTATAPLP